MNTTTSNLSNICQKDARNSIEQTQKSENRLVLGPDGFMHEIKTDSMKNEWIDIGGAKKWKRKCPECNKDIWVKSKDLLKTKHLCRECGYKLLSKKTKIIRSEEELKRNCPKCESVITYKHIGAKRQAEKRKTVCKSCQSKQSSECYVGKSLDERLGTKRANIIKKKISQGTKGRIVSENTRYLISQHRKEYYRKNPCAVSGINNPMYGIHRYGKDNPNYRRNWTEEQKDTAKVSLTFPRRYNKNACIYLDSLSKMMGWNLQHAENGGEFVIKRYLVDGYDKERNIVVEYDERHHYSGGKLKQKDIDRMNKIMQYTGCKFYRYNERTKELREYTP